MILLLLTSFIVNLVLAYTTWNLFRKNEIAENFIVNSYMSAKNALSVMKQLDDAGAFEADDETGVTFQAIKSVIEDHARFVGVEEDVDTETNDE